MKKTLSVFQSSLTCSIQVRSLDGPDFVVRPVHLVFHWVVVNSDGMLDLVERQHYIRVVRHVQRDFTDVPTSGQQQQLFHAYKFIKMLFIICLMKTIACHFSDTKLSTLI